MKEKYNELLTNAFRCVGEQKFALLEEALRIADQYLDTKERYTVRVRFIDAAIRIGRGKEAIDAFNWCLHAFDQHPDQYHPNDLLRQYEATILEQIAHPHFHRQQIEEAMLNFRKRLRSFGRSLSTYYQLQMEFARQLGDRPMLEKYYHQWLDETKDCCHACELHQQTLTLIHLHRLDEAYQVAKPLLEHQYFCGDIPNITYSYFLLDLLRQNKKKEAARYHRLGIFWINAGIPNLVPHLISASRHLEYLTIVHRKQAAQLIERCLPVALATPHPLKKFYFLRSTVLFFPYRKELELTLPKGVTINTLEKELYRLAEEFDRRNNTHTFTKSIDERKMQIAERKKQYSHS